MENRPEDKGKQIEDIVRDAIKTGDLSSLKKIGPVVGDAVNQAVKTATNAIPGNAGQQEKQQNPQRASSSMPQNNTPSARPAWQGNAPMKFQRPRNFAGVGSMVGGSIGMMVFVPSLIVLGTVSLVSMSIPGLIGTGVFAAITAGFAGLFGRGWSARKMKSRVLKYYEMLHENSTVTFEEISRVTGWKPERLRKDVQKAMDKGMMPDVWMDKMQTCIIYGQEAYSLYLEAEAARQRREQEAADRELRLSDPALAGIEHFKQEGAETLKKIRVANDRIPDTAVSDKLYKLESTTGKIFTYVEKHPEKLSETRRFMNYYLPTTLKLVEKYCQYDEMEVEVASVAKVKQEISDMLDTINTAFMHLLDSLYQDETLDVVTDMKALETVLVQEGLSGGPSFGLEQPAQNTADHNEETTLIL